MFMVKHKMYHKIRIDWQEFLWINKALQTIQSEVVNNTSKLTEINECIKKENKKLKEVEDDPTYSEEKNKGSYTGIG